MVSRSNEVRIEVTGDAKDAEQALKSVQKNLKSVADGAKKAGVALTAIGAAFAGAAFLSIRAASDLEESLNAINVVFGESTQTINEFGVTAARSAGLAQASFNQLATVTGALLTNFGFSQARAAEQTVLLTQRAADMASVFNEEVVTVLQAVNAALRGEADPIERFGVGINEAQLAVEALTAGITKSVTQMTMQEKVSLRLTAIMRQTEKVAGDFANTSDGLANRTRILRAQFTDTAAILGDALIPTVESLLGAIAPLVTQFGEWAKDNPQFVKWATLAGLAIGGIGVALVGVGVMLPVAVTGVKLLAGAFVILRGANLGVIATQIFAIGTAAAIVTAQIGLLIGAVLALPAVFKVISQTLMPDLPGNLSPEAFRRFKEGASFFDVVMAEIGATVSETVERVNVFGPAVEGAKTAMRAATEEARKLAESLGLGGTAGAGGGLVAAVAAATQAVDRFGMPLVETRHTLFDMSTVVGRADAALSKFASNLPTREIFALSDETLALANQIRTLADASKGLTSGMLIVDEFGNIIEAAAKQATKSLEELTRETGLFGMLMDLAPRWAELFAKGLIDDSQAAAILRGEIDKINDVLGLSERAAKDAQEALERMFAVQSAEVEAGARAGRAGRRFAASTAPINLPGGGELIWGGPGIGWVPNPSAAEVNGGQATVSVNIDGKQIGSSQADEHFRRL